MRSKSIGEDAYHEGGAPAGQSLITNGLSVFFMPECSELFNCSLVCSNSSSRWRIAFSFPLLDQANPGALGVAGQLHRPEATGPA
jgi:hypothetical protein